MTIDARITEQLRLAHAHTEAAAQRALWQLAFAEQLCLLHPDLGDECSSAVARARMLVQACAHSAEPAAWQATVAQLEEALAPLAATAKSYTVYCAGHAHIDMNWMWPWPETVAVVNDTFATVLRLMDEFPEFYFSQSQASTYAIIERYHPALLARIRQRVSEGRWEVTASHWVEGDKNLVGGESLCRHLLYTRRYMQALFGLSPEDVPIDWAPDTFGHAWSTPGYLSRGGVRWLYHIRSGTADPYPGYVWVNEARPPVFWWRGPDGSRVLALREQTTCAGPIAPERFLDPLCNFARRTGLRAWLHVYGVGDHGGGPVRRDLLRAREMNSWPIFPRLLLSPVAPFFQLLEAEGARWPELNEELNFEFSGCYSSVSLLKRVNRLGEMQLQDAEVASALVWAALGEDYPAAEFRQGWENTLFNQFHDILPGTCTAESTMYADGLFQQTAAACGMAETRSLRRFAELVDTSATPLPPTGECPVIEVRSALGAGAGFGSALGAISSAQQGAGEGPRPFVLFNPCGFPRREVVTATIWDNNPHTLDCWTANETTDYLGRAAFAVRTPSGSHTPAQLLKQGSYWGHEFATFAFATEALPALGYGVYTFVEASPAPAPGVSSFARFGMENELLRVEVDPSTGGVRSLVLKEAGLELVDPAQPTALLSWAVERPHGGSAWTVEATGPRQPLHVTDITRRADGPLVSAVEVQGRVNNTAVTLSYELRAGEPGLRVTVETLWAERGSADAGVPVLYFMLPLALADCTAHYEMPFGAITRPRHEGQDVPAVNWGALAGRAGVQPAGCIVANTGQQSYAREGNTLRLTLLRSTYDPDPVPEIGQRNMALLLRPFAGDFSATTAIETGAAFNHPLRLCGAGVHPGRFPAAGQFLALAPGNVALAALKKAEDDDTLIVRLYETAGQPTDAILTVNSALLGAVRSAQLTDVLERPLPGPSLLVQENQIHLSLTPYDLVTVQLQLARGC